MLGVLACPYHEELKNDQFKKLCLFKIVVKHVLLSPIDFNGTIVLNRDGL